MATTLFGDETEVNVQETGTTQFGDVAVIDGDIVEPTLSVESNKRFFKTENAPAAITHDFFRNPPTFRETLIQDIITDSDRFFDPVRQGQAASELLRSIDEPDELQRVTENRMILSKMFNVPEDDIKYMDNAMLKQIFGDELISLKKRFEQHPMEGGFFMKMGEAFRRGDKNVAADIAAYQAVFEGQGNISQTLESRKKQQLNQALTPIEGNAISNLFYKSAQIVPGMLRGYSEAVPEAMAGMITGITTALIGGVAGPQAVVLEEVGTVPAGAVIGLKIGLSAGAAEFWYKQGAGSMVSDMLDKGYDADISRNVAGIAAIPYALIELSQVSQVTPGLRTAVNKAVSTTTAKVLGEAVKKYGKTLTSEVLEEIAQEIIQLSAEDISGILSDADIKFDKDYIADRSARIWETAKESTQAMALLPVPGMVIDVNTGIRRNLSKEQIKAINDKLPETPTTNIVETEVAEQATEQAPLTPEEQKSVDFLVSRGTERSEAERLTRISSEVLAKPVPEIEPSEAEKVEEQVAAEKAKGTKPVIEWALEMEDGTIVKGDFEEFTNHADLAVKKGVDIDSIKRGGFLKDGEFNTQTQEVDRAERVRLIKEKAKAAQPAEARPATIKSDDNFDDFFEGFEADEVVERKPAIAAEVQSTAKTRRDITEAIRNDPVFKTEAESIDVRAQQIDLGFYFIPEKFKGEVKTHLEGDPSLRRYITHDPTAGGSPFDTAVLEGFARLGEEQADIDVTEFLERLSEAKASRKKIGGIPQIILDKMIESGDPFSQINAMRHDMFHKGFTVAEINEATADIAREHRIQVNPLLETKEDVETRKRLSKRTPGAKGKLTRQEAKAAAAEKETAAQLKSRIKKLHKSTGVPVEIIREILRTNKTQKDVAAELREAQEEGQAVGFRAGEQESRQRAKVEILKLKQAQKLTEARRKTASELVKTFVAKENRGDFLKRIAEAKSPRDLEKITEAIEKGVLRAEKKEAVNRLKAAVKAINPKKMLPEFAGTAQSILDSLQLGKISPETELKNSDMRAMAQQVLDTAREDSVAAFQAQQILDELRGITAKTFAVNKLSIEALDQITDTLVALRFQNEADTIAAKGENAKEAVRRRGKVLKSLKSPPTLPDKFGGKAVKKFKMAHDNMESALDAIAGARPGTYQLWKDQKRPTTQYIYDVLDDGVDQQIEHSQEARDIFRGILADNGVTDKDILNWSLRPEDASKVKEAFKFQPKPQVKTFVLQDVNGKAKSFDFTANELMDTYMHSRNAHNLTVLLNEGRDYIRKGEKVKVRGFTVEKVDDMINSLTPTQRKVARQTGSKLMDGFNKDAINEASVELEFFELAKVGNYYPARRSIIRTPKGQQLSGAMQTIEGLGAFKERVGTGNPLRGAGFFETVYATNRFASAYVGLAKPLREVKSVWTRDVIEKMENIGRPGEAKLITDLIVRFEDQTGVTQPLDTIIKKMLGGFAKSKLFLNAKIAPRQQISEFLISAYVDPKYLTEFRGLATKEIIAEITALSPQLGAARFEGLQFDRDVGDAFQQNQLMNYLTGKTSLVDKTALGMRFFDTNAITDIYRAVKAEVIDNNPGVNINSTEGKALLKDRFEWVTRHTQPMWQTKDRSLLGSDPRPLVRALTMFMSQREQLVRMVNNSISDFANSEKTAEDYTRIGRSLGAVAMSMAAFTLYNIAWATLIHRKKKDVKDMTKDAFKDILSLPFFGKYLSAGFEFFFNALFDEPSFRQSFGDGPIEGIFKDILIEAIPNYTRAGKHFVTKEKYKSGPNKGEEKWVNELVVATDALLDAIASLKGLPYYGAKDIARSIKAQTETEK